MRVYTESSQESLRARDLLMQWKHEGLLSQEQYQRLEAATVSDLRTTNIYLRLVLLLFTLIAVAAAVALFFAVAAISSSGSTAGTWFLVFGALSYIAAEVAAARTHLYHYGIEEALAICSVAFVCIGLGSIFVGGGQHSEHHALFLVSAIGAVSSLWLWYRFEFWYAFPAAMVFAALCPTCWTPSHMVQRCLICVLYAGGLTSIAAIRSREISDFLRQGYSLAEAFLWLGSYLVLNLKLSAISVPSQWWGNTGNTSEFSATFYWTTWVLLWCLPPLILARGVRQKDRFVLAVGMITIVLTLATNKPYLGWKRHSWDPMLLGIALIAVAVLLIRWFARGPGGVQQGFTAARMSGRHKHALAVAPFVMGFISPQFLTPAPQPQNPEFESGLVGARVAAAPAVTFEPTHTPTVGPPRH